MQYSHICYPTAWLRARVSFRPKADSRNSRTRRAKDLCIGMPYDGICPVEDFLCSNCTDVNQVRATGYLGTNEASLDGIADNIGQGPKLKLAT